MKKSIVYTIFFTIFSCFNCLDAQKPDLNSVARASNCYKPLAGTTIDTTTIVSCAQIKEAASVIREFEKFKHIWRSSVLIGVPIGITASRQESLLGIILLASCVGIGSEIFLQIMQYKCQNKVAQLLKDLNDLCAEGACYQVLNMPIVMDAFLEAIIGIEDEKHKEPFYFLIQELDHEIRGRLYRFGWLDDFQESI